MYYRQKNNKNSLYFFIYIFSTGLGIGGKHHSTIRGTVTRSEPGDNKAEGDETSFRKQKEQAASAVCERIRSIAGTRALSSERCRSVYIKCYRRRVDSDRQKKELFARQGEEGYGKQDTAETLTSELHHALKQKRLNLIRLFFIRLFSPLIHPIPSSAQTTER